MNLEDILKTKKIQWNLSVEKLYELAIQKDLAQKSSQGALVFYTGKYSGRIPQAKYIVKDQETDSKVWWGKINQPMSPADFDFLYEKCLTYLTAKELYGEDAFSGADPRYQISIRVLSENPVYALFAKTMFRKNSKTGADLKAPKEIPFTILHAPKLLLDPKKDKTNCDAGVVINFSKKIILIIGTAYAGEIKKSVFTLMNYLMPEKNVLPMHCSANFGPNEKDAAIFFGLSGTGKTTLSASEDRNLVGDDEHGWSDHGIFNFEGGCYAKAIRLSRKGEPEIYNATQRFGTLLENVAMNPKTGETDFNDESLTENTRASYPISFIPHMSEKGTCGHPKHIFMLTCDAFGILPPVAKLTPAQAQYHFLSGYTAKVAGTETGVREPQATFSPCFGAPFMPRSPLLYAELLAERIQKYKCQAWLVNTGWIGGAFGKDGNRIPLEWSRAIVSSVLTNQLQHAKFSTDPVFGFLIPNEVPGVPEKVLNPESSWKDVSLYKNRQKILAQMFHKNLLQLNLVLPQEIKEAGPRA